MTHDSEDLTRLLDEVRETLPSTKMRNEFDKQRGAIRSHEDLEATVARILNTTPPDNPPKHDKRSESLEDSVQLTGRSVIQKLRKVATPPGKKGSWMKHLNDQQLAEVYHRLSRGQSAVHIAKIAQTQWGLMQKSEPRSIARTIRTFARQVLGEMQLQRREAPEQAAEIRNDMKKAERIVDKLDGLGRLRWLIDVETDRLVEIREREKTSIPFRYTDRTVKTLGNLLDMYLKYQVELGILDSKPSEFNLNIKHRFEGLMEHSIRGDGATMINATNRFLELAESKALTLRKSDDGQFMIEGPQAEETASMEDSHGSTAPQ